MKESRYYNSQISDTNEFASLKQKPKIYPTVNQDGSYQYLSDELDSENSFQGTPTDDLQDSLAKSQKKDSQESGRAESHINPTQIILLIAWVFFVILLIIGLVISSFNAKYLTPNNNFFLKQGYFKDEQGNPVTVNTQYIIVSQLGRPFGCSFYLDQDITNGLFIEQVQEGGPAEKAGLIASDQVLCLDDKKVETILDVLNIFKQKQTGDKVTVLYARDGVELETTLVLQFPQE